MTLREALISTGDIVPGEVAAVLREQADTRPCLRLDAEGLAEAARRLAGPRQWQPRGRAGREAREGR